MKWRGVLWFALLLAAAAGLTGLYRSDHYLFELPDAWVQSCAKRLSFHLAKDDGLALLLPLDEAQPVEWIGRREIHYPGTDRVPGRFGSARRFDGKSHAGIETTTKWSSLGLNYTLSLWLKLADEGRDQEIWYTDIQGRPTGLKLRNGQMTLFVPGGSQMQCAAYPFTSYGRFVHLAAVVSSPNGTACLYENGELMVEVPVEAVAPPVHNIEFGKMRWYVADNPVSGDLDEIAAWNRALTPREIRRLAQARQSLLATLQPWRYLRWHFARTLQAEIKNILKLLDRFNLWLPEGGKTDTDLPEIVLHFSSGDARHFVHTHEQSLASGRRTDKGAKFRRIFAQYEGKTVEAQLQLDGSDDRYEASRRPGFILLAPADAPVFGVRRLHLVPPENLAENLAALGLALNQKNIRPTITNGLCRLLIGGQSRGIYYFESYDQFGLEPGERSDVTTGSGNRDKWGWLFRALSSVTGYPCPGISRSDLKSRLEQVQQLLASDLYHPWSRREWSWRVHHFLSGPAPACPRWTEILSPYALLGRNPSPDYIVGDLELQAVPGLPSDLAWSSSRPDIIDDRGHVQRPDGDRPVQVVLTASRRSGDTVETRPLPFRVMPRDRKLPALMLYVREPLSFFRRADFTALYHPAHDETTVQFLEGGQDRGAGIKHHGNTTFWDCPGKKPLSLEFDEPHHLLDGTETRHLNLLNGCVDTTRLKNKLAYDLFRAFAKGDQPRYAPETGWTEVFINGVYSGVYEMSTRIHGAMLGVDEEPEHPEAAPLLFRQRAAPKYYFAEPWDDEFAQVLPPPKMLTRKGVMLDLLRFTSLAKTNQFAQEAATRFDLDNLIDYLLLINATGNVDGRTANFYMARDTAPGSGFFIIPYDFDHSFEAPCWLSNFLYDRLRAEVPGFEDRLRRRWAELRQGPLARTALAERLGQMAATLDGYMDWDMAQIGETSPAAYLNVVADLQQKMATQLDFVDSELGYAPAGAAAPQN